MFLASDEASYITGAVLPVDGGYLLPDRSRLISTWPTGGDAHRAGEQRSTGDQRGARAAGGAHPAQLWSCSRRRSSASILVGREHRVERSDLARGAGPFEDDEAAVARDRRSSRHRAARYRPDRELQERAMPGEERTWMCPLSTTVGASRSARPDPRSRPGSPGLRHTGSLRQRRGPPRRGAESATRRHRAEGRLGGRSPRRTGERRPASDRGRPRGRPRRDLQWSVREQPIPAGHAAGNSSPIRMSWLPFTPTSGAT